MEAEQSEEEQQLNGESDGVHRHATSRTRGREVVERSGRSRVSKRSERRRRQMRMAASGAQPGAANEVRASAVRAADHIRHTQTAERVMN